MTVPLFREPVTVEIVRDNRDDPAQHRAVVALVDGEPVAFRTGRNRRWSCRPCGIRTNAECHHVALVQEVLRCS